MDLISNTNSGGKSDDGERSSGVDMRTVATAKDSERIADAHTSGSSVDPQSPPLSSGKSSSRSGYEPSAADVLGGWEVGA